uniref:Uncharacterized protein n=1 Tax=Rhizophagus irregularis (strain DAOM 181602 / DAOM 197198 / MUCL 43194) TaxID=747089 RepID=U9TN72_RHIID
MNCIFHMQLHIFVGDLSKKEAEEYFEKHVLPRYECKELEGKFDQVCKITGTRMLIIDMYVGEYERSKGKLADRDFSVYELEYDKLYCGLNPNELHPYKSRPPLWKDDDLIKTMEAITISNRAFIFLLDLTSWCYVEKMIRNCSLIIDYLKVFKN